MKRYQMIIMAAAVLLALLAVSAWWLRSGGSGHFEGDGHDHSGAPAAEAAKDDHGEEPVVHLTEEQRRLLRIEVRTAETGGIGRQLRLNGEIRLNLDETARIMPRMPGFVTRVAVREGERVRKGQLLACLTSHKLGEYYSEYNSAAESEKLTLSEFRMAEKLYEGKAMSEKEFLRYKREYAEAVIAKSRAEALLRSLLLDPAHGDHAHDEIPSAGKNGICTDYEIRAPFDGTVVTKNITVGENFPEDNSAVVFTVSNLDRLWLDLRAPHAGMRELKTGMTVEVIPADSDRKFTGKIVYLSPVIDEATRTGLVRVLLTGDGAFLRPGEFAAGIVRTGMDAGTVVVPREAVQLIGGETAVFVPEGDGFAPRPVSAGESAEGVTQLLSGLAPGEKYVASGAFELKSILLTGGMDPHAGHGH